MLDSAKAMEGVWDPGAGARRTSRRKGRGTVGRLSWELERASSAPVLRGPGAWLAYNRRNREVAGSREAVGGGRSSDDRRDNTTRPERRAPASSMRDDEQGGAR